MTARDRRSRTATGVALGCLAAGALGMSAAFFLHVHRATGSHAGQAAAQGHVLPGVTLANAQAGGSGLIVTSLASDGQARRLGFAVGDDIVQIDGQAVRSLDQAAAYLLQHPQGSIHLALRHGGAMRKVTFELPEDRK
ncbi:MAG: PDZ domain-containing protein [Sphingobium sp.]